MRRRLARHHFPLALATIAMLVLTYWLVRSPNPVFRWSMSTAYVGMALLVATLITGPLNVLRGRPNPTSADLRRDIGIWAGVLAVVHFLVGWQVHMKHRYLYWLREVKNSNALVPRTDLFGFANYTGLAAVVIALILLTLSNDYFLARLGSARWKRWQRWNYAFGALVLIHGISFQVIERRKAPFVVTLAVLTGAGLLLQFRGYRRKRRDMVNGGGNLASRKWNADPVLSAPKASGEGSQ